jgi:hypothetical protein
MVTSSDSQNLQLIKIIKRLINFNETAGPPPLNLSGSGLFLVKCSLAREHIRDTILMQKYSNEFSRSWAFGIEFF